MKRRSEAGLRNHKKQQFDFKLFEDALEDPESREIILKLLNSSEQILNGFKKAFSGDLAAANQRPVESPLAMSRRRALEQINGSPSTRSDCSLTSTDSATKNVPFNEILLNVTAYVELISNGEDKSSGAKTLLTSMGATVSETFTRNVTHVIFKDGCYETYQKAKLWKVHFVSVLWLETSRRNGFRALEKNFPALGRKNYGLDFSVLCSQMQKEYGDIIKEEVELSLNYNSPSYKDTSYSTCTLRQDEEKPDLILNSDIETSDDDSDCVLIDGHSSKNESILDSIISVQHYTSDDSSSKSLIYGTFSASKKSGTPSDLRGIRRNGLSNSFLVAEKNKENKSPKHSMKPPRTNLRREFEDCSNSTMSPLRISSNSSKKSTESLAKTSISNTGDKSSSMSPLRLSSEHSNSSNSNRKSRKGVARTSTSSIENKSSTMSPLRLSSEQNGLAKKTSSEFSSLRLSSDVPKIDKNSSNSHKKSLDNDEMSASSYTKKRKRKNCSETDAHASNSQKKQKYSNAEEPLVENAEVKTPRRRTLYKAQTSPYVNTLPRRKINVQTRRSSVCLSNENPIIFKPIAEESSKDQNEISTAAPPSVVVLANQLVSPPNKHTIGEPGKVMNVEEKASSSNQNKPLRRFRKLYDPEEVAGFLCHDSALDDDEERQRIRLEKMAKLEPNYDVEKNKSTEKNKVMQKNKSPEKNCDVEKTHNLCESSQTPGTSSKNLLLTQKALDYIKNNAKKPSKTEMKKKDVPILYDSDDDQKELAREIVFKEPKTQNSTQKPTPLYLTQKTWSESLKNRRSSSEFQELPLKVPKVRTTLKQERKPTIVCTKMQSEVKLFQQIVKKLGTFEVENDVSARTTHLVVGEVKRTMNLMKAIARGCWILRKEWLTKSLEKQKWLREDEYEVIEFSAAVQKCRLERQAFGTPYTIDIFKNCGMLYVAKNTVPANADLRDLIILCKGKVTKNLDKANIVVGEYLDGGHQYQCVSEKWILDSISQGKLKNIKKYLIEKTTV